MSGVQTIVVKEDESDVRLDRWFKKRFPDLGHGQLEKLLRKGEVRLDGARAKSGTRIAAGQSIRIPPLVTGTARPTRQTPGLKITAEAESKLQSAILHRDRHIIAIDKAAGLAVQGGSGIKNHLDAMLDSLRFDAEERPRLVHRLDKDTSGVLLLARTAKSARFLTEAFRTKETEKVYWAAVHGVPRPNRGEITGFLRKERVHGGDKVVMAPEGQSSHTTYRTISIAAQRAAWLELRPHTGRTHQLRVHCAAIGTPVLGDGKYGGAAAFLDTDAIAKQVHLHARSVTFPHPGGGTRTISAPLPPHMVATWKFLGFEENDPVAEFDEEEMFLR